MAFEFAMDMLPQLFYEAGSGANILNQMIHAETQQDIAQNQAAMSQQLQNSQQNFQTAQALNGQNFLTQQQQNAYLNQTILQQGNFDQQNSLQSAQFMQQKGLQQNAFQNQLTAQNNAFQQQNSLTSTIYNNNLKASGLTAGLNFGSSLVGTGLNYLVNSSLMNQQAALQRENFTYMTGKASDALSAAGLPTWMAYTGASAMSMFPKTAQVVSGMNTFNSQVPGNVANTPFMDTPSQISMGVGNIPTAF